MFVIFVCLFVFYYYHYWYHYYNIAVIVGVIIIISVIIITIIIISFVVNIILVIIIIIFIIIIINFYVITICFIFDGARLWQGLDFWQISGKVNNKRNSGTHEVDENDGNIFIYICCLFIYLFIISFKLLKLRWIYSVKRDSLR